MSRQYNEYLKEHVQNVQNGIKWMIDHKVLTDDFVIPIVQHFVKNHDASKWNAQEYDAYDDYFYRKGAKEDPEAKEAFDYAWLEHIHHNPHHWQYWVLVNDDEGKPKALDMPDEYIWEMIADWWSFSWKEGTFYEIFNWYAEHEPKMILSEKTKQKVDDILDSLNKALDADQRILRVKQSTDGNIKDN